MNPSQLAAVDRIVRAFLRAGAPAEPDDLRQEAYLTCLEVQPRIRSEVTATAYYSTAIRRRLGHMVSRQLSVVSIPRSQLRNARQWSYRCPHDDLGHSFTPERHYAFGQIRAEVDRLLTRRIDGRLQRALDTRFGADRLEVLLGRPRFLAFARRSSSALADLWSLLGGGAH